MRILQINKFFYRRGGSESYYFDLIELLESKGHEIIHFSMKHPKNFHSPHEDFFVNKIDFDKREGIISDLKKFFHSLYSLEAKNKLEKLILKTRPDVAHLHNISHHLSPSILTVLKKHKIPVVQTLHDYQLICPNFKMFTKGKLCERCRKYRYWNAATHKCVHNSYPESFAETLEMFFHRACQIYENSVYCFVTPSDFLKRKIGEWGVTRKVKIENIPNFINSAGFEPEFKAGSYVLYFGRLVEEKGLKTVLEAMSGTDLKLKIAGEGPEKDALWNMTKKLGIDAEFLGYKTGEELRDLIRNAKFVVLPAVWYENYPMSLLEAGTWGKAVIGSNLGGIPEIIHDGENGFLAESGNIPDWREKMVRLWGDNDLCERMGRRARENVIKENGPENHYKKIISLYELISKNN